MIEIAVISIILFFIGLAYLKIALKIGAVDTPNKRSSHVAEVARGGGIIIPIAIIIYTVISYQLSYFIFGILILAVVSFIDDLRGVANRWRLLAQLVAVAFLLISVSDGESLNWIYAVLIIIIIGTINAVNFMDGINGITVVFGAVFLSTLLYLNTRIYFADQKMLVYVLIAIFVFGFFNFRPRALCFAGDVGSISLGFLLVYLTILFYQKTNNIAVVSLWAVYGVDSVLTIINRLIKKENIFKPHRTHLYQYFANELGKPHLKVALMYGLLQLIINILFLININYRILSEAIFLVSVLSISGLVYTALRLYVINKIAKPMNPLV